MADTQVQNAPTSPTDTKHKRGASTAAAGVYTEEQLKAENKPLVVVKEVERLNWKINTSTTTLADHPDAGNLKKPITNPPISKLHLRFPTGITLTARNKNGVTIKDAFDVIWKQYRKKVWSICILWLAHSGETAANMFLVRQQADDEIDLPVLARLEFDAEDYGFGTLLVRCKKEADAAPKKKK